MSTKSHRGKTLAKLPSKGRGRCPVCGTLRIKVLYDLVLGDKTTVKVCKRCQNKKVEKLG